MTAIAFRPLAEVDLSQLHAWLQQPHVRRWWRERRSYEETVAHYLPAIRGEEPSDHYVIVVDGRDAGMIQTYLVSDYADRDAIVEAGEGVAGVDLLLGEPDLVGRGLGTQVLAAFVREVVLGRTGTHAVGRHGRGGERPLLARLREGGLPARSRRRGGRAAAPAVAARSRQLIARP